MKSSHAPIGLFDSGVGGLTIWKEIKTLMPSESTIYIADNAHMPYGDKSREDIIRLSVHHTQWLIAKGCKIVVVACNTATTNAIGTLRARFPDMPFIGIEPAIKPASLNSKTGVIGVLATKGTLVSDLFKKTSEAYGAQIRIISQDGDGLAAIIQSGQARSKETRDLLTKYLEPMLSKNIDYLVLGCTHYPLLIPLLEEMLPPHVRIIDSGAAVAQQTQRMLEQRQLLAASEGAPPTSKFYATASPELLTAMLGRLSSSVEEIPAYIL